MGRCPTKRSHHSLQKAHYKADGNYMALPQPLQKDIFHLKILQDVFVK